MPTFDIIKKNNRANTFRTQSIVDRYELKTEHEHFITKGNLDIERDEWSIGLIVGASGTGKSTIARTIFSEDYFVTHKYNEQKAIIDEMPENKQVDEITAVFNSVGLGTAWSWLKPYNVLSTGEKMRVDLARSILEDRKLIVFDEFTSVVDRNVAKIASFCVSKAIKKEKRKFVAVSCHRDIIEWLEPDWIFDTDNGQFFFVRGNTKDHRSKFQYAEQIESIGSFSENIII